MSSQTNYQRKISVRFDCFCKCVISLSVVNTPMMYAHVQSEIKEFNRRHSESKGGKLHTDPSFTQSATVSGEGFEARVRCSTRIPQKEKNRQLKKIVQITNDIMNDMRVLREQMSKVFEEQMSTLSVKQRSLCMNTRELSSMAPPPVEELVMRNFSVSAAGETASRSTEVLHEVNSGKIINSSLADDGSRWYYFGNLGRASAAKDAMMEPSSREFAPADRTENRNLPCFVNQAINALVHAVQNINEYFRREWNLFNDIFKQEAFEVSHVEPAVIACIKGEDTCTDHYLSSSHLGYLNEDLTRCDDKKIVSCHSSSLTYIK